MTYRRLTLALAAVVLLAVVVAPAGAFLRRIMPMGGNQPGAGGMVNLPYQVQDVLEAGYRTPDIAEGTGGYVVTTSEFGELICQAVTEIADMRHAYHAV